MSAENISESLSDDLKAKLKNCRTDEEMKKVLEDSNIILDADVLENVSGGVDIRDLCPTLEQLVCPDNFLCPRHKPGCLEYVIDL